MKTIILILSIVIILYSCSSSDKKIVTFGTTADTLENITTNDTIGNETNLKIDDLVNNAQNSGRSEDLTLLWKATLNLKQWHFITKYQNNLQDRRPFVGIIDNQPWVFVFTDRQKAQVYCLDKQNQGFTDNKGGVMIISMDTDKAIEYIMKLKTSGVYGMRINEGKGWFSPIANLAEIIKLTKQ